VNSGNINIPFSVALPAFHLPGIIEGGAPVLGAPLLFL
jgi:hypothetical protein